MSIFLLQARGPVESKPLVRHQLVDLRCEIAQALLQTLRVLHVCNQLRQNRQLDRRLTFLLLLWYDVVKHKLSSGRHRPCCRRWCWFGRRQAARQRASEIRNAQRRQLQQGSRRGVPIAHQTTGGAYSQTSSKERQGDKPVRCLRRRPRSRDLERRHKHSRCLFGLLGGRLGLHHGWRLHHGGSLMH